MLASFELEKREFTYGQMDEEAKRIAAGLFALGVDKGDRVAIWGPNQSEWYITKVSLKQMVYTNTLKSLLITAHH